MNSSGRSGTPAAREWRVGGVRASGFPCAHACPRRPCAAIATHGVCRLLCSNGGRWMVVSGGGRPLVWAVVTTLHGSHGKNGGHGSVHGARYGHAESVVLGIGSAPESHKCNGSYSHRRRSSAAGIACGVCRLLCRNGGPWRAVSGGGRPLGMGRGAAESGGARQEVGPWHAVAVNGYREGCGCGGPCRRRSCRRRSRGA